MECLRGLRELRERAVREPDAISTKADCAALRGAVRVGVDADAEVRSELVALLGLPLPLDAHMLVGTALSLCLPTPELLQLLDRQDGQEPRQRLCLCHGVVAAHPALLTPPVLSAMLRTLVTECVRLSRLTTLAFRVLANCLQRVREAGLRLPARATEQLVVLLTSSWEVPLSGVRESCSRALAGLLDLAEAGLLEPEPGDTPVRWLCRPADLLLAVMEQHPWTAKSKYFLLCVLLPRVRVRVPLPPGLARGLLIGAASSHLVSAASDVYAVVLRSVTWDEWRETFFQPVVDTLCSGTDRLLVLNILNHWIQPTVKVFPKALADMLMEVRVRTERSHAVTQRLALTFLLRIARREGEGVWDRADSWEWQSVTQALQHSDKGVRGYAFAAVCDSGKAHQAVSTCEADAVRLFLEGNVHVDCAALRQSLLGSLSWLLMRARNSGDAGSARLLAWLHHFLLDCLEPGSNYQRKITALSAYLLAVRILQDGSGSGPRARKGVRRGAMSDALREHYHWDSRRSLHVLLLCLTDPTDDIREAAGDVLLECASLRPDTAQLEQLADRALGLCRSQRFYEADSGALLARVVSSWGGAGVLSADALLQECECQLEALRRDVLQAATCRPSPLHGVLTALRRVALRPHTHTHTPSPHQLLSLLEAATEHCLALLASTSSSEFAPSFAEMGEAIDHLVAASLEDEEGVLTLSPAHQLVLNCIWLNLKACCEAASDLAILLARSPDPDPDMDLLQRCSRIPVAVLTRCRHKGAIEAAGLALQRLVRSLTESPHRSKLCDLPLRLLRDFLGLLLEGRTASGTSVSRRSAGLGILVHRIVVGDQQSHKPLLQECVRHLLEVLTRRGSEQEQEQELHDSAEAQALHFLRMLVADAGLRVHLVPHLSRISLLCFQHLTSPVWSIRNASLQLFGAVVPKLVGQRKCCDEQGQGQGQEQDAAVDELVLRYPELVGMLLSRLELAALSLPLPLEEHAQLVPLLSLLSRVNSPSTILASTNLRETLARFKAAFFAMFESPIAAVRTLAAKAYARFTPVCESVQEFRTLSNHVQQRGENRQVSCLTAMDFLKRRILVDGIHLVCLEMEENLWKYSLKKLESVFLWQCSPSIKHALFLNLSGVSESSSWRSIIAMIENVLSSVDFTNIVGIDQWTSACLLQVVTSCQESDIPEILNTSFRMFKNTDVIRFLLQALLERIDTSISIKTLEKIVNVCIYNVSETSKFSNDDATIISKILMRIVCLLSECKASLSCSLDSINDLAKLSLSSGLSSMTEATFLPVISGLLVLSRNNSSDIPFTISKLVQKYSCPVKYHEDIRMCIAKTLKYLGQLVKMQLHTLQSADAHVKDCYVKEASETVLLTSFQLFNDEDCNIREEVAKFVAINIGSGIPGDENFYSCIQHLLSPAFMGQFLLSNYSVFLLLWKILSEDRESIEEQMNMEISSPFSHSSQNIFAEGIKTIPVLWQNCDSILDEIASDVKSSIWIAIEKDLGKIVTTANLLEMKVISKGLQSKQYLHSPGVYFLVLKCHYMLKLLARLCNVEVQSVDIQESLFQVEKLKQEIVFL